MSIAVNLTEEERNTIHKEIRAAFLSEVPASLKPDAFSYKVLRYVENEYNFSYQTFLESLHDVCMTLYKDNDVRSRDQIIAVMKNKRYHNMDDWELESFFKWLNGDDVYEFSKRGFFDSFFPVEDVEDVIQYVIDNPQNV